MDKNNDIQVNKVDKWCEGVADVSLWQAKKSVDMFLCGYSSMLSIEALDAVRTIYVYLDEALDHFNELEAKYQKQCGMISEYEEEKRALREQRKKLMEDNDKLREELRIREKEKDEKDKLIDELNSKIMMLKLRTNAMYGCYGLNPLGDLNKENEELKAKNRSLQLRTNMVYGCYKSKDNAIKKMTQDVTKLEKENKDLKDTLETDGEFGKYVGKCVADSIQEGWKYGAYELHPYTRIDIRVEETKNTSMSFKRYSIPNVVVLFNNTQTDMERDTAQHECKELNRKIKKLERENKSLRRTVRFLDEGGSYEFYSCPVARECENFKPKVHHSYDPLDDLPDVEHS